MRCDELIGDLFPHLSAVLVKRVFFKGGAVRVMARTREAGVACPGCAVVSDRVHSRYGRCLADTPVGDRPVLIELTVRRLYCGNIRCSRHTFAEQVEGLTIRYGRRTPAAGQVLEAVAIALAGRAGSRLSAVLHPRVGRTTSCGRLRPCPILRGPTRRGQHTAPCSSGES